MSEEFLKKILWTFPEQDVIKTIFNFYEDLQQKVEQLEKENRQLCDVRYSLDRVQLEKRIEQLEKELKETNNLLHKANDEVVSYCNRCIELENIRKEAITYILAHCEIIRHKKENVDEVGNVNGGDLLNILNKGSEDK